MTGTVKLHGKHADIIIEDGNNFKFMSRNSTLTMEKDLDVTTSASSSSIRRSRSISRSSPLFLQENGLVKVSRKVWLWTSSLRDALSSFQSVSTDSGFLIDNMVTSVTKLLVSTISPEAASTNMSSISAIQRQLSK